MFIKNIIKNFEKEKEKIDEDYTLDADGNFIWKDMSDEKRMNYIQLYFGLLCEDGFSRGDSIIKKKIVRKSDAKPYSMKSKGKINEILYDMVDKQFLISKIRQRGKGRGRTYKSNIEVIKTFIKYYAFTGDECKWAEQKLEETIKDESWRKTINASLSLSIKDIKNFQVMLLYQIFIRLEKLIGEDLGTFEGKDIDKYFKKDFGKADDNFMNKNLGENTINLINELINKNKSFIENTNTISYNFLDDQDAIAHYFSGFNEKQNPGRIISERCNLKELVWWFSQNILYESMPEIHKLSSEFSSDEEKARFKYLCLRLSRIIGRLKEYANNNELKTVIDYVSRTEEHFIKDVFKTLNEEEYSKTTYFNPKTGEVEYFKIGPELVKSDAGDWRKFQDYYKEDWERFIQQVLDMDRKLT